MRTAGEPSHTVYVVMQGAGRVAIVTGGSRGIGREVARTLASQGYAVVLNYAAHQGEADAAVGEILGANGTALAVRGDVADELDVERLFAETAEAFGGVDVVVHAAARTTLYGTFVVNQHASRQLRPGGTIVNVSTFGEVEAITATLSAELRERDITVNTIAPGPESPGSPADIANLVAYLVTEPGHRINGQVIRSNDRIV